MELRFRQPPRAGVNCDARCQSERRLQHDFALHWAGSNEDEDRIKEETKATIRCYPFDAAEGEGVCFYTGQKTDRIVLFARAY